MVPLDWLRSAAPMLDGMGQARFYRDFRKSVSRAAFDMALLVALIESIRLCCFVALHADKIRSTFEPQTIAQETLDAWPDGCVATR